jgi:hypothetical protein
MTLNTWGCKREDDMKRLRILGPVIIMVVCLFCVPLFLSAQEKKEGEELYTIKKGDTLWEISGTFLKDPFLWPKLWQRNPYITNPHWIYPGQPIRLATMEPPKEPTPVARKAEPAKPPEEELKPVELKPVEVKPPSFYDVRDAGFFGDVDYPGIGVIIESKHDKNLLATDDIVYLAFKTSEPIKIGDKFTIFKPYPVVRNPVTGKKAGRKYRISANLQIIDQYGDYYTGKIIEAFYPSQRGDRVMPYLRERMDVREEGKN